MQTLEIVRANFGARKDKVDELRSIDEEAVGRAYTEDEDAKVTELRSSLEEIDGRLSTLLEQELRSMEIGDATDHLLGAMLDRDSGEVIDTRSIGQRYAATDGVKEWLTGGARGQSPALTAELEYRAVTDVTLGATSGGALTRPDRLTRIGKDFLDRRTYLLDLLPSIPVSQGSVEYVQDVSPQADFSDKATEVTEGTAKPQAGPTFAVVAEPIPTMAAWVNITRQTASDVPQVMGYLDGRLRYSLRRNADKQAINGTGVAPLMKGLLARTGIVAYAPGGAEARFISIRHAIRMMEDVETVPEIIVLNPADAEIFDLSNATSAGIHATPDETGGLTQGPSRTAWGLTQVHSTAIAAGTAMLVDPMSVAVLDRQQVTSYMTDSHASNFTSNILTLLLECRLGLALFDPKGVCKVTFNGTT
ncbi:MAG TPA: phage major capsid protein [Propionibacteriaceae bacterium]|nr:phage major capsid protein [Propionibacteriaceae bacterium]